MVVVDAVIQEKARAAVRVVERSGRVRAAYLFGSHVEGGADADSDIDIAAFVEGAGDWNIDTHLRACGEAQRAVGLAIQVHIFPASWCDNPPRASFAQHILRHGVRLAMQESDAQPG